MVAALCLSASSGCNGGAVVPRPSPDEPKQARIEFSPATHDLGRVDPTKEDGHRRVKTTIRNRGTETLRILALTPSCSCTVTSLGQYQIKPGESTVLATRIRLGNSSRPQSSVVSITVAVHGPV